MKIGKVKVEYIQDADDYSEDDLPQTLTITAQPALLHLYEDNKPDFYFVLQTERWAFDDETELLELLKDFKKRIK